MIQNAAARLVFSEPKRAHVTPLFVSLHWLSVAARIKFKTLMLAYRTATGSARSYFHSLMTIYIPSRSLQSAINKLQQILQNAAARVLTRSRKYDHITPILQSLDRLPIKFRISYKILLLAYKDPKWFSSCVPN